MSKHKILFVVPSLAGGGAERIVVLLLEYLDKGKYEPILVTFETVTRYTIKGCENLKVIGLNKYSIVGNSMLAVALAGVLRKEKPAVTVSFMNFANIVASAAKKISFTDTYLVHSDHSDLTALMNTGRYGVVRRLVTRCFYKVADKRICVSLGVERDICENWGGKTDKCLTIHNPVDYLSIQRSALEAVTEPWLNDDIPVIIACGRLSTEKNYPLLLSAFSQLIDSVDVRLVILGEGEGRLEIKALVDEHGLSNSVKLLGFVSNPFSYLAKSTIFVLSSDWEGFGNVIIEAMACGLPVISTRCPSGPEEIISHMENGILFPVGDVDACTSAIQTLLCDEGLRQRLSEKGRERSKQFDISRVVKQYEAVFDGKALSTIDSSGENI
ncbi:MAG: glycosyltransferase [Sedimenticola sp.]